MRSLIVLRSMSILSKRARILALSCAFVFGGLSSLVNAQQAWPLERAIHLIVPFPAGSSPDLLARLLAAPLSTALNQTIVVENKPGAGGNIGTRLAARAAPDGYTITVGTTSVGTNPALYNKLPYDTLKDFTFISQMGILQLVLSVHPALPVKTLDELIAYAKKNPGKLNYSSFGNGTMRHFRV